MGAVLAKVGRPVKQALASGVTFRLKRRSGLAGGERGKEEGQGTRTGWSAAAEAAGRGRGRRRKRRGLGSPARLYPSRRRAGRLVAGLRGAPAPEDGHAAPRFPRFSPHHGADAQRRLRTPHRRARPAVRGRPGVRRGPLPARPSPRPRPTGRGRQVEEPAPTPGRGPQNPTANRGRRLGPVDRNPIRRIKPRGPRRAPAPDREPDPEPERSPDPAPSRGPAPLSPPRAPLQAPRRRPQPLPGGSELPPQRGHPPPGCAAPPLPRPLARGPRSPRGGAP